MLDSAVGSSEERDNRYGREIGFGSLDIPRIEES
jgi:hypothetical protein